MPTYHSQPSPTWRDRFAKRELRLIKNVQLCRGRFRRPAGPQTAADQRPAERDAGHAAAARGAAGYEGLLRDFFEARWREGKLSDLWSDEDVQGWLGVLASYLGGRG